MQQKSINFSNVFVLCFRFVFLFCVFVLYFCFMFLLYVFAFCFHFKNTWFLIESLKCHPFLHWEIHLFVNQLLSSMDSKNI